MHGACTALQCTLQVDPAERLTAAAALEQLPGKDKVVYPTAGSLLDVSALASQGGADAAELSVGSPRKRTKGTKGGGAVLLSPRRVCELLEFENARSADAAAHYWSCSAAARERGPAGMAACALLAGKNYEIDLHSADELCGAHPLLEEYDEAEYAEDELVILKDLEYCLVAP